MQIEPPEEDDGLYELSLNFFTTPPIERNKKDLDDVAKFLDTLPVIKQFSESFTNHKEFLLKCCDKFEHRYFQAGSSILSRGDPCDELIIILKGLINLYDNKPPDQVRKQQKAFQQNMLRRAASQERMSFLKPRRSFLNGINQSRRASGVGMDLTPGRRGSLLNILPESLVNLSKNSSKTDISSEKTSNPASRSDISVIKPPPNKIKVNNENPQSPLTLLVTPPQPLNVNLPRRKSTFELNIPAEILRMPRARGNDDANSSRLSVFNPRGRTHSPVEDFKNNIHPDYDHFHFKEKILLKDEEIKAKYIKDGASLLRYKSEMGKLEVVNSKFWIEDRKSTFTMIVEEDTDVIVMSKDTFNEVFAEEFAFLAEKKKYFASYFSPGTHVPNAFLSFIIEKTHVFNDKIYEKEAEANGVYFIKSGQVKFSATLSSPSHENSPREIEELQKLKREVVGTQWQRGCESPGQTLRKATEGAFTSPTRKYKCIVGTSGEGNSFGEEGLLSTSKKRTHTAFAASGILQSYFLSAQYFSSTELFFPRLAEEIVEKGNTRNEWLYDRIQEVKEVQETIKEANRIQPENEIETQYHVSSSKSPSIIRRRILRRTMSTKNLDQSKAPQDPVKSQTPVDPQKRLLGVLRNVSGSSRTVETHLQLHHKIQENNSKDQRNNKFLSPMNFAKVISSALQSREISPSFRKSLSQTKRKMSDIEVEKPSVYEALAKQFAKKTLSSRPTTRYVEGNQETISRNSPTEKAGGSLIIQNFSQLQLQSLPQFPPKTNSPSQIKSHELYTDRGASPIVTDESDIGAVRINGMSPNATNLPYLVSTSRTLRTSNSLFTHVTKEINIESQLADDLDLPEKPNPDKKKSKKDKVRENNVKDFFIGNGGSVQNQSNSKSPVVKRRINYDHLKVETNEDQTKKKTFIRSNHNMFRMKPHQSNLLAVKYQIHSPIQS